MIDGICLIQKEVELQKIQILDSNFQSKFNFETTIIGGMFVGLLVLYATLFYQKIIDYPTYIIGFFVTTGAVFVSIYYLKNQRQKHVKLMSELITKINNYDSLPSLETLNQNKN